MPKEIVILGAGGHARVIVAALSSIGTPVLRCIAADRPGPDWPASIEWLGDDGAMSQLDPAKTLLINGLGSTRAGRARADLFEFARTKGLEFAILKHPSAVIDDTVSLGQGAQIMAGAILQTGTVIGQNTIINTGAIVDHDCSIGEHAHLAPGCCLSGNVSIGNGVHVGVGAVILQNVSVGEYTTIGAGSVVVRDVKAGKTAFGVPATEQQ